jgi:CRP/FNR family transcriptional regulator
MIEELQQSYGNQFEPALIDEIKDVGILMEWQMVMISSSLGNTLNPCPYLLSGSIKILRPDDGDELLLYYLEKEIPVP